MEGNLKICICIVGLHVTSRWPCWWCVGDQKQKHFSPLGTKRYFHVNSLRKNSFVLTTNMAALSCGCKPRIGIQIQLILLEFI